MQQSPISRCAGGRDKAACAYLHLGLLTSPAPLRGRGQARTFRNTARNRRQRPANSTVNTVNETTSPIAMRVTKATSISTNTTVPAASINRRQNAETARSDPHPGFHKKRQATTWHGCGFLHARLPTMPGNDALRRAEQSRGCVQSRRSTER